MCYVFGKIKKPSRVRTHSRICAGHCWLYIYIFIICVSCVWFFLLSFDLSCVCSGVWVFPDLSSRTRVSNSSPNKKKGKGVVNPVSQLRCGVMMLRYLNEHKAATSLENALEQVIFAFFLLVQQERGGRETKKK